MIPIKSFTNRAEFGVGLIPLTYKQKDIVIMFTNTYMKNAAIVMYKTNVPDKLTASSPSKISLRGNNSFSMLAGPKFGCPGATEACKGCYAMKGHHFYPGVQAALAKNWLLVKQMSRHKSTNKAVSKFVDIIPAGAKVFRIHESSDFISNWYVDVWDKVIKSRPDVKFWAYTRSFNLDYSKILTNSNFTLWASTDDYNGKEANKFVRKYHKNGVKFAYGPWDHNKPTPASAVICPVTSKKLNVEGACEKCKLCIERNKTKKNIVFLKH